MGMNSQCWNIIHAICIGQMFIFPLQLDNDWQQLEVIWLFNAATGFQTFLPDFFAIDKHGAYIILFSQYKIQWYFQEIMPNIFFC